MMICPNCSKDLTEYSFIDSLAHVTTCLNSKEVKLKKKYKKKIVKNDMCLLKIDSVVEETIFDSTNVKLIVTKDGRIIQKRLKLTKNEIKSRISNIFKGNIVCNHVKSNEFTSANAFQLSTLTTSHPLIAKGFEKYMTEDANSCNLKKKSILVDEKCSPGCGYLV